MSDPITLRPYQPGDEVGILAGHNQTFTPPRSLAHWLWKFRDNPTGQIHTMVAAHETAGIVGAYVTLPVTATIEGKRRIAGQCVDLFVLPDYERRGFGRRLLEVMTRWLCDQSRDLIWLTTDPGTRAERFYRTAGWTDRGFDVNGERRFEWRPDERV